MAPLDFDAWKIDDFSLTEVTSLYRSPTLPTSTSKCKMNTYVDDMAGGALVQSFRFDLDANSRGHPRRRSEVARFMDRLPRHHNVGRQPRLIGAVPPIMLKTSANPGGFAYRMRLTDLRSGAADRSQFRKDLTTPPYAATPRGSGVSQARGSSFLAAVGMMAGQSRLRLHQGVLGDRFHRRLSSSDVPPPCASRRRRLDCSHGASAMPPPPRWCKGATLDQAGSRGSSRYVLHSQGPQ